MKANMLAEYQVVGLIIGYIRCPALARCTALKWKILCHVDPCVRRLERKWSTRGKGAAPYATRLATSSVGFSIQSLRRHFCVVFLNTNVPNLLKSLQHCRVLYVKAIFSELIMTFSSFTELFDVRQQKDRQLQASTEKGDKIRLHKI
jgi:hypothetical protein